MIKVVVTGVGVVSSNAWNANELYISSIEGKTGIKNTDKLKDIGISSLYAGEITCDYKGIDKYLYICDLAIKEIFNDSGLSKEYISSLGSRSIFSLGTSVLASLPLEKQMKKQLESQDELDKSVLDYNDGRYIYQLNEQLGNRGDVYVINTACASGTMAVGNAFESIRSGGVDVAIAGGVDVFSDTSISGFNSMQNMSSKPTKPFDENREGLNIGEAAAFFVLESEEHALARGAKIYAEVFGYDSKNDAYHITAPDPNGAGAYECMKNVISEYTFEDGDILYINAHGTGTSANDPMEISAIERLIEGKSGTEKAWMSSSKSMLGHCLGAAGAIELAICVLCQKHGQMPLSISVDKPLPMNHIELVTAKEQSIPFDLCISNSFAFAGNCASIGICKYI
ncbi:beta-ketoacyl-[acyl-carrier-protein] synthase family protein [Vallitalea guaymasensis]|uniref:3-oxoacyl-[acyl-carrier-protein] synthase 1 n=1 Tax=Vallitalea guaymasensis TaxID=1185412 RepID=A0A8J8SDP8_9FIRM|nr:beta-ketoacyl-[acyl-carrier-protein] synthase family protein [Vallitalea guaymasensis]QUH30939.1 beta-ketoacyl-[acyl-carrier-protein] synthase family protein [Vallitalea guaymasensis]